MKTKVKIDIKKEKLQKTFTYSEMKCKAGVYRTLYDNGKDDGGRIVVIEPYNSETAILYVFRDMYGYVVQTLSACWPQTRKFVLTDEPITISFSN